jgi:regulator of sigma E protease
VFPQLVWSDPETVIEKVYNPFKLLYLGTARMLDLTYKNFVSIQKMFTGSVSVKNLGGPILIGKIAGESLSHGLVTFLFTMAILSIGLGVLNILPVPVLDGGHIVLLFIEAFRKKPLTMRQMEVLQQIGFSLIILLMIIVMKNDISRLINF